MEFLKNEIYKHYLALIVFLIVNLIVSLVLFKDINKLGIQDWDQHYAYAEAARSSILKYKQIPLWNPYHCGGTSQIGNPQNDFLSPGFVFPLMLGPVVGYKILFIIYLFISLVGFYYLGLYYNISKLGSILLSHIYMLSGLFIMPFSVGMTTFLIIALLPHLYLLYLRGLQEKEEEKQLKYIIYSSLILALIFFGGYHYILNIVFFLFVITLVEAVHKKKSRPINAFLFLLLIFLPLISIKLLPSIETIVRHERRIKELTSGYNLNSLSMSLLSRNQSFEGFKSWKASYGIDENGMYVGFLSLALFLLGLFRGFNKDRRLLIIFLLFLFLSLGTNINPSLYKLLHSLPFFDHMRVAQRYRYFFMIPFVLFIGLGFDFLRLRLIKITGNTKITDILLFLIIIVLVLDIAWVNLSFLQKSFCIKEIKIKKTDKFTQRCGMVFYDENGVTETIGDKTSYSDEYIYLRAGYGSPQCYEPIPIHSSANCYQDKNYKGEFYFENDEGKVDLVYWSPNIMVFNVEMKKNDKLIINQNYDINWKAIIDNGNYISVVSVENLNGLLSLSLGVSTTKKVILYYLPSSFLIGTVITLIGIITIVKFLYDSNFKTTSNNRRLLRNKKSL